MAHTAKHKKEQKDKANEAAKKDSKKAAQEQFKKFLEEKGKKDPKKPNGTAISKGKNNDELKNLSLSNFVKDATEEIILWVMEYFDKIFSKF